MRIGELAHQTEDVLSLIRSREMVPTPERARVLLAATDKLHEMIQNPGTSNQADIADIVGTLDGLRADCPASTGKRGVPATPCRTSLSHDG